MRILQLIQKPQKRGAETFALQLSAHLVELGHDVLVISLFSGPLQISTPAEYIALNRPLSARFFDFTGFKLIAKLIRERDIQMVQANAGDTLKYAVLSKALFGWKARIVFRNASTVSQYIRNPIVKTFNRWLYQRVDYVISVAEFTKLDLLKLFPELRNKITVVPIGVEFDAISSVSKKIYDIIHVGGFSFEKNHRGLLSIYRRVKQMLPDVKLVLIGDGPLRSEIERRVAESADATSITFLGSVQDALPYIRAAKVLVLPSILEGLPAVLLESFMCKVPVVSYDVGGISEIVLPHQTGKLVPVNREEEFSKAVTGILQDPISVEPLIERAYSYVREKFNNVEIAKTFEKIYRDRLKR